MSNKALYLTLLLTASPMVMADSFYQSKPTESHSHHEATSGGIGLVVGTLAGGPIGAIIGGSMGIMVGNQQTKTETIVEQKNTIDQLEKDINEVSTKLNQSKIDTQAAQSTIQSLRLTQRDKQQQYREALIQFANSYQLDIYFTTNSSLIEQQEQNGLDKLAKLLQNNSHIYANIEAYSDWRGTDDANCLLAQQRLTAVNTLLTEAGSKPDQLLSTNYGEHAANNKGSWGEELFYDRRVTITLNYFE